MPRSDAEMVADALAIDTTDEMTMEYLNVLLEAIDIFLRRSGQYGKLWQESGMFDNLMQVRSKAARMKTTLDAGTRDDSGIDGINYFAFAVMNGRAGRFEDVS